MEKKRKLKDLGVLTGDAIKRVRPVCLARKNNENQEKKLLSASSWPTLRVDLTYSIYTFFVLCRLFV